MQAARKCEDDGVEILVRTQIAKAERNMYWFFLNKLSGKTVFLTFWPYRGPILTFNLSEVT